MRHLTFTSVLALGLALAACGDPKTHPTALQKTIPAGRAGAHSAKNGCLRLDEIVKRIGAVQDGVLLHSYDYDLAGDAKSAEADQLAKLKTFRALRGPGQPLTQNAMTLGELLLAPPLDGLLDVAEQKGCATVTFASGYAFRVTKGDARAMTLTNDETGEARTYTIGERELLIRRELRRHLNACEGDAKFDRTEAVTFRVAWGPDAGQVKLATTYATLLGAPAPVVPDAPAPRPGVRPRLAPRPAASPTTAMLPYAFDKLSKQALAGAASLTCRP